MHAVPPYYMHGAAPKMQSYPGADGVHDHADDGVLLMVQFVLTDADADHADPTDDGVLLQYCSSTRSSSYMYPLAS